VEALKKLEQKLSGVEERARTTTELVTSTSQKHHPILEQLRQDSADLSNSLDGLRGSLGGLTESLKEIESRAKLADKLDKRMEEVSVQLEDFGVRQQNLERELESREEMANEIERLRRLLKEAETTLKKLSSS
jgi:archaellum component FlaC